MSNPISSSHSLPVHLDGTALEGGGQLLRLALSLSSLTGIPIYITDIRGKRGPKSAPGKGGGLKPAHLAGLEWLAKATRAETKGMVIKSRGLVFRPARDDHVSSIVSTDQVERDDSLWRDVYENGRLVRRESRIAMSTPGSIFLILQAILPYLLFHTTAPGKQSQPSTQRDVIVPLRITIEGGTNVSKSPSFEYVDQVLFPMLRQYVGITSIKMTLRERGWTTGRTNVGCVVFDVIPFIPGSALPAFSFSDRGSVTTMHVSVIAPSAMIRTSIKQKATEQLLTLYPNVEIFFPVDEDSRHDKRLYLLVVAQTSNGYRFGRDWLYDRKIGSLAATDVSSELVKKVLHDLQKDLAHKGCVDEYMQDQLVVFQGLAEGSSWVDGGDGNKASLHTRTARWVVQKMLGLIFDDSGCCKGLGYRVRDRCWVGELGTQEEETLEAFKKFRL
ncbi:hypothetical protein MMC12_006548 [Toensbergia leucococca]|nr:hypothetical protein [Toensbergia leucococca]